MATATETRMALDGAATQHPTGEVSLTPAPAATYVPADPQGGGGAARGSALRLAISIGL
jgi:hypothetical protein